MLPHKYNNLDSSLQSIEANVFAMDESHWICNGHCVVTAFLIF